jgi:putative ATP-binding cassette transporter
VVGAEVEPPSGAVIQLEQIVFTFEPQANGADGFVLGPVDLTVRPGELLFIIGGNGSGKSTFVKLLTGLYLPNSGRITVNGQAVTPEERENYREQFSVVFSDFHLFETLPGVAEDDLDRRAQGYLRRLDLDHKVRVEKGVLSTTALSPGQRRRLALLAAY